MNSNGYSYINNNSYRLTDGENCRNNRKCRNTRGYVNIRQGRNRSLAVIFGIVFVITSVIASGRAYAGNFSDNTKSDAVKMYKSVMVYSGDTLESLAVKYMGDEYSSEVKYINEIAAINGLCVDASLTPGNCIIIPYYMNTALYYDTDIADNTNCISVEYNISNVSTVCNYSEVNNVDIDDNSIDFYVSF